MSLNKAMIIGYLGRDPESRTTQQGNPVATFSVATTERYDDVNGVRQERTEWHNVVAYGKTADICRQYLAKGRQVYVEGKMQTREWTDRSGGRHRKTEIVASGV
ncbi:MAG TPA: single-stranded DNA-binding protein [Acidobacteriota bacterium]|nr:single-stranded DNA-binding protein [Acidobacteriota bacterium]